jgi:predicted nuclease of predicted toxin-antitoxin system
MKIKLDENMPLRLVEILRRLGHDPDTVPQEGLIGRGDKSVWDAAQASGRFLITQDLDFSDARQFVPGTHHGILLVRLREPGRNALLRQVETAFSQGDAMSWLGNFVVLTEHKVRIHRVKRPR